MNYFDQKNIDADAIPDYTQPQPPTQSEDIQFCPHCGANLRASKGIQYRQPGIPDEPNQSMGLLARKEAAQEE